MRACPQEGIELIKKYEGLKLQKYLCPGGYWTIGYGHKLKPDESYESITEEEAFNLLIQDLLDIGLRLRPLLKPEIYWGLNSGQLSAIYSFTFNVGPGAFQRSTLRQKINRQDDVEETGDEFLRWSYGGGKWLKGLYLRRLEERRLYVNGK